MAAPSGNERVLQTLKYLLSSSVDAHSLAMSVESLNEISADLARDTNMRSLIGRSIPSIWPQLEELWEYISKLNNCTFGPSEERSLILAVSRFTRNVITADSFNQNLAIKCEPCIRALVHRYTSYANIKDPETFIIARFLMQTLSNLITSNDALIRQIWGAYMAHPEDQNILLRMLAHPDDRTLLTSLVFITNCIAGCPERMRLLVSMPSGVQTCVRLLDGLSQRAEAEEGSNAEEVFDIGWNIFKILLDNDLGPILFSTLSIDNIVITPHQTTLLKIIDTYLLQLSNPTNRPTTIELQERLRQFCDLLVSKFFELSDYARSSIQHSLGPVSTETGPAPVSGVETISPPVASQNSQSPLRDLDMLLPKVCEALVLVTQCFCTMALAQDESAAPSEQSERTKASLSNARSQQGNGFIEDVIELLRLLDTFLPRIVLGKASWSTPRPGVTPSLPPEAQANVTGFNYLKRDLVRLLGILCYDSHAVQDRVRESNGITVVMNLCVTDELNPYLREHALFTLRNLLHGNAENQAVVDAIKPMGTWDENGMLRDMPGTRK